MNIFVVRHGQSEHNVDRNVMAHTHDSRHSLTKLGEKQVKETGLFLKGRVNEKTIPYSSPYLRTMQTAEAIHSQLPGQVPFYQNPLVREWELGNLYDFNNRTPEAKKEYKAAGQFYFRYQNGESLADVYLRASMFMNTVIDRLERHQRCENVIVVSHAAFMHMLLAFLMNWPVDELLNFKPIENGAVLQIRETAGIFEYEKIFVPEASRRTAGA